MSRLRLHRVSHRFGLDDVLGDIELEVVAGETVALVGRSGCGKTTLLHIVAGLLTPAAGQVDNEFGDIGCVFQQTRLLPWQSVLDNLVLGLKARGVARTQRYEAGREWAIRMGLAQADLAKYPHELSGGMRSRVALGRALAITPELLLLDEPFSALDVGLKLELYALLQATIAERRMAVLMITHDLMEAVRLADRVLMMAAWPGRLIAEFQLARPPHQRSEAWVYQKTGELMQHPALRAGFSLPALTADQTC